MLIRPANEHDTRGIIGLIGEIWSEYDCILDTDVEERYLLSPGEYFRSHDGEFWVAEDGGRVMATVAVMMLDPATAELKSLYVHPSKRGKGMGEHLVRTATEFAGKKGASEMILWSDTRFTAAHRLYERLGFRETGTRKLADLNNSVERGFKTVLGPDPRDPN